MDLNQAVESILKRYDRIGFGRRGVLDAEQEIRRFAGELSPTELQDLHRMIVAWIHPAEAERLTAPLHYNLPEHLQALAIRLCASLPVPDAFAVLQPLHAEGAFHGDDQQLCHSALEEALAVLAKSS